MEGNRIGSITRRIRVRPCRVWHQLFSIPGTVCFTAPCQKHQSDYDRAAETILKATNMDDSMDSVQDEEQGIRLYRQLSCLLTKAGMHARKWLFNSPTVLSEIPIQDRKSEVDLDRDQLPCAKTLGYGGKPKKTYSYSESTFRRVKCSIQRATF